VRARVPLDIDIEDRLVYGLTPIRLAYAVLAVLAAMAVWSAHSLIDAVRIPICVAILAAGASLAWGRVRGRAADAWLFDIALFVWRTRRVKWHGG
jgi:PrgI family protein